MKPGDLVRILPDDDDEPDSYDGLIGLIIGVVSEPSSIPAGNAERTRVFRLMVNGNSGWWISEDRLEIFDEAR